MTYSVNSRLQALSETINNIESPTEDIQAFVRGQLQTLRTEMLKHDEVVAEHHKVCESNKTLREQSNIQREEIHVLNEQITVLRQSEKDIKARSAQFERESNDWKSAAHVNHAELVALKQEIDDLRRQLREFHNKLSAATTLADEKERLWQESKKDAAAYKVFALPFSNVRLLIHYSQSTTESRMPCRKSTKRQNTIR